MQLLVDFEILGTLASSKITFLDKSGLFYNDRFRSRSRQYAPRLTPPPPGDWPVSLTLIYKSLDGAMTSAIFFSYF